MKASILYLALVHVISSQLIYFIFFTFIITCNDFTAFSKTNSLLLHVMAILDTILGFIAQKCRLLYPVVINIKRLSICWKITLIVVLKWSIPKEKQSNLKTKTFSNILNFRRNPTVFNLSCVRCKLG